jgi:hypothetical protein
MCLHIRSNGTKIKREIESNSFSCAFQSQGHNMNGWYFYCVAAAFGLKLTKEQMVRIGCNEKQRQICRNLMEWTVGFGIVPEQSNAD